MSLISDNYIKIFFIIILILYNSEEQLIENPKIILPNAQNPAIFNGDNQYYYIITPGNIHIVEKLNGNIAFTKELIPYSSTYFICEDELNNHYFFADKDFYEINLDSNFENINLNKLHTFDTNIKITGCIKHFQYSNSNSDLNIERGEIIVYGKKSESIYFYYNKKQKEYDEDFGVQGDELTCKLINNIDYFCLYINSNEIKSRIIKLGNSPKLDLYNKDIFRLSGSENSDNIIFFDTENIIKKIFCFRSKKYNRNECYRVDLELNSAGDYIDFQRPAIGIYFDIPIKKNNCAFTWFYSEYLFCCVGDNIISCNRINDKFNEIYQFKLNIEGANSDLNIINNTDYASLYYINKNSNSDINLFEYIIYPPVCQDISEEIIVFHDFEINVSSLFEMKTNNPYKIRFSNLPFQYGDFSLNGVKLNNNNEQVTLNQQENIIYFISTNNKIVNHLEISYNVSIESTYSALCKIDLTIVPCYRSCHKCFKSREESDENNHNCLLNECEQDYYESPLNENNCYSLEEKNKSWYLDNTTNKYGICHEECYECSGPSNSDCISCNKNNTDYSHLYKGLCLRECPEGTYEDISNDFYICKDCYINCKRIICIAIHVKIIL